MKQYLDLLKEIKNKGSYKEPAREGMPGTLSLFGHQFRCNLQDGFPLLTTKKMFWKGVVVELLWFLRGDANIKYLIDNGVNIWNEDAYNYYVKLVGKDNAKDFTNFIDQIKQDVYSDEETPSGYKFGDCGYQYGKVWRNWEKPIKLISDPNPFEGIDQIKNVIESIKKNPYGRRHMVTAIDPAHEDDLALYWCHAMFQFNCRKISLLDRILLNPKDEQVFQNEINEINEEEGHKICDEKGLPKYYLDCQLYQRSADVFLGVPFNIASYALLTHIIAKICNMIPGEFIHTFGDVHIYDNHMEAVNEQLKREPKELPKLDWGIEIEAVLTSMNQGYTIDQIFEEISNKELLEDFRLLNYNPDPSIKAELSTGLLKK